MSLNRSDYSVATFKKAIVQWWKDDPFTQSAAVAYYTIFSFPALIILYFAMASVFLQEAQLQQQLFGYLEKSFGENAANTFQAVIERSAPNDKGFWPFILAGSILIFAALRLFLQLQKALNAIWEVDDSQRSGFRTLIVRRLVSFAVMLGVLFVLAVSLILTSSISTMTAWLMHHLPDAFVFLAHGLNLCFSLVIISMLFAVILKKLPDIDLTWKNVYPGALIAAFFFMLGEYLLSIYFGTVRPASPYGVTGSVILLMIWVSYSCSILLLGAEYGKALRQQNHRDHT